ncbi:MAG TPA: peptidoglycan DD-metalloendopeptidase family protein [Nocardioidaceae bacterium]|nr:peptidoglycan DD-metalloendopeptidase family protein [Nocardioidaceae bacterium]
MVRSSRPARARAGLVAGALACGALTAPVAHAARADDDLHGRKSTVEKRIAGAHQDLDHSSGRLRAAAGALEDARVRLGQAQARLADTRGQLAAARAFDAEMAARLTAAVERLRRARAELAAGRRKVVEQQETLGRIVVQNYQQGDPSLLGLSMVLTSQDPTELTGQLNSVSSVIDKQAVVLARLEATRALLTVQESEVAAARVEVARRREAAAANLERKQSLESRASAAEAAVAGLVTERASARQQAARARASDLAELAALRREQERIAAVLQRRAAAARARATAAGPPVDAGPADSGGALDYPVQGAVTSPYGWRTHPIHGYRALHDGTDFGAACGTPIRAATAGTVLETYFQTAYGNRVVIDHGVSGGVGLATISNHLSAYAVGPGDVVQRGQVIGYVGSTGWSTGCHLHYTVLENGVPVDPMTWF